MQFSEFSCKAFAQSAETVHMNRVWFYVLKDPILFQVSSFKPEPDSQGVKES